MTFPPSHQKIIIEFSIFADIFSTSGPRNFNYYLRRYGVRVINDNADTVIISE